MNTFGELEQGSYYVIQEVENTGLELIYIPLITEKCVLVEFQDDDQTLTWFKKTDPLFEIVEQLTDEQAIIYESLFEDDEDDEEDDDFFWGDSDEADDEFWNTDDDEDDEDDFEDKAKKN